MTEALQNPLPPDSVACPRFHLSSVLLWFGFHKSEPVSVSSGQWPGLHALSPTPAGEGDCLTMMEGRESELRAGSGPPVCLSFPFLHHAGLPQTPTSFEGEGKGCPTSQEPLLWDLAET